MGATGYLGRLQKCVGHDLLLVAPVAACIRDTEGRILALRPGDGVNRSLRQKRQDRGRARKEQLDENHGRVRQ